MQQNLARAELTLWTTTKTTVGGWDERGVGLGGWSLSPHHVYDPSAQVVYYGDGDRRTAAGLPVTIRAFAGSGTEGDSGDGGAAISAALNAPAGIAAAPDGTIYFSDSLSNTLRRVTPDGTISAVSAAAAAPNLIKNPSAEEPIVTPGQVPGWTVVSGTGWTANQPSLPTDTPEFDGVNFFYAGAVASGELRQDVDLTAYASTIDAGSQAFDFQGYERSFPQPPPDTGEIILQYLNASGTVLATYDSGALASENSWQRVEYTQNAPIGTRTARVRLIAVRNTGLSCDGYFDDFSLVPLPPTPNLLKNGSCDDPGVVAGQEPPLGWSNAVGAFSCQTTAASTVVSFDGGLVFYAGSTLMSETFQDVDVSSFAAAIDASKQSFLFGANVISFNQTPTDAAEAIVEYRDVSGNILSTYDSGEIRQFVAWLPITDERVAPIGTRVIRVRLLAHRYDGVNNDGNFDGVFLRPVATEQSSASVALNGPSGVAVGPDGSVYVVDRNNHRVVRYLTDGSAAIVAGTGTPGVSGDGGPASAATLFSPTGIVVSADGTVYVADTGNQKIRRIATDGTIGTFAGSGQVGYSGDGGPGIDATFFDPMGLALASDGTLYIADHSNAVVRAVGADGRIATVAGTAFPGFTGDGGPAKQAELNRPTSLALTSDGSLYIGDDFNHRVRLLKSGIITTFAGSGVSGASGDGGQALSAQLSALSGITVAPDQSIVIADGSAHRIRRVAQTLPGVGTTDIALPRPGTDYVDIFDSRGKHLRTVNSLSNTPVFAFSYDSSGRLVAMTDFDGNVTQILRDSSGAPTTVVAPFGQQTIVSLNSDGYLATVTDPLGDAVKLGYGADGLLTSKQDARGNVHTYDYEPDGRLKKDSDPAGGFKTLSRVDSSNGYTVTKSTALGRTNIYAMTFAPDGSISHVVTGPDNLTNSAFTAADGTTTDTSANGMSSTTTVTPDPRFGLLTPLSSTVTSTPSGLASTQSSSASAVLSDPTDPLSLVSSVQAVTTNGRTSTTTFNASTLTYLTTSPGGRTTTRTLDAAGRTVQEQVGDLTPVSIAYDSAGRVFTVTQGNRVTRSDYFPNGTAAGYLQQSTDPLGNPTSFTRDALGRALTTALGGQVTGTSWDPNDNLSSVTPPGKPTHSLNYSPVDLLTEYDPPPDSLPASSTSYSYDVDRALQTVSRPDGISIGYGYDTAGRLQTTTTPTGTSTRQYFSSPAPVGGAPGALSAILGPYGQNLAFTYDGSLPKSTTWSGGVTGALTWGYDADYSVTSQTVAGGTGSASAVFGYDLDKLLTCASPTSCTPPSADALVIVRSPATGLVANTTLGGVTEALSYNGFGELASQTASFGSTSLASIAYDAPGNARDLLGRVVHKAEVVSGNETDSDYHYDSRNRLSDVFIAGTLSEHYEYDDNGNRLSVTTPSGTISATYDAQDRLLTDGTLVYTYSAHGDLETKTDSATNAQTLYAYDALGNLLSVSLPNGTLIDYLIDGENRRVGKKVNGTLTKQWLYADQTRPIAELDGAGNLVSEFVYGMKRNVPEVAVHGGKLYRIVSDGLGSPRVVVDAVTGTVAQRMRHDAWGRVVEDTNPAFVPFGFAGGMYDADTGLVRFGARDYDPDAGRWINKDPLIFDGGQANLYVYIGDVPINHIDSSGNGPEAAGVLLGPLWPAAAAGAVIVGGLECYLHPNDCKALVHKIEDICLPDDEPVPDQSGVYQRCYFVEEDDYACYYVCPGDTPQIDPKESPDDSCQYGGILIPPY